MTSDAEIVERLRELGVARAVEIDDRLRRSGTTNTEPYHVTNTTEWQAADSITRLSARVEELERGLAILADPDNFGASINVSTAIPLKVSDFARSLLTPSKNKE